MQHTLSVEQYGPIKGKITAMNTDKRLMVIIGTQATGKSTVAKLVQFFEMFPYIMGRTYYAKNLTEDINRFFERKFSLYMRCPLNTDTKISYKSSYGRYTVEGAHKFEFRPSEQLKRIEDASVTLERKPSLLSCSKCLYLPAWRSFFSALGSHSSFYEDFAHPYTACFIRHRDNLLRSEDYDLSDLKQALEEKLEREANDPDINDDDRAVCQKHGLLLNELIQRILHASYSYSDSKSECSGSSCVRNSCASNEIRKYDKIRTPDKTELILSDASSGQQAIMPVLLSLYYVFLEQKIYADKAKSKKKPGYLINIEEPEAHLFPESQVDLMKFIALIANITNSRVILTTHSPYILHAANLLMYSAKVEKSANKKNSIVPLHQRIAAKDVSAFLFKHTDKGEFCCESILEKQQSWIDVSQIDTISSVIDNEIMKMMRNSK